LIEFLPVNPIDLLKTPLLNRTKLSQAAIVDHIRIHIPLRPLFVPVTVLCLTFNPGMRTIMVSLSKIHAFSRKNIFYYKFQINNYKFLKNYSETINYLFIFVLIFSCK